MNQLFMGISLRKRKKKFECLIYFFSRLQILLLSDVERVRAASLRALRYSIHRMTIFDKFLESRLDYLVCR
jgi:hypothetical protein